MGIWHRISSWFFRARRRYAARQHPVAAAEELPCEPEKPWGCGWFDSSLDLRLGLKVIEHPGAELALAVEQMLRVERSA